MPGKVWLVGAGPGDPGLLTLRARSCLEQADVVIYDRLVSSGVLRYARPDAERVYAGKEPARHARTQEQINRLLIEHARAGRNVARLKGGDPFVFGRGAEEALALRREGIPFEVVPGVSSAIAVPAYAGIPLTERNRSSSFAVVTGHRRSPESDRSAVEEVDWRRLAPSVATLVIMMGITHLPHIVKEIRSAGRAGTTPVAVIQWGTTSRQKTVVGMLDTIEEQVKQEGISNPAIVVVGQVAGLAGELSWWETRPLHGWHVLLPRQRERAEPLARLLDQAGAGVSVLPLIQTRPVADDRPLCRALAEVGKYQWLVLTSVNGVDAFWQALRKLGCDARHLAGVRIAVVGPATGKRLESCGLQADLTSERGNADDLAGLLLKQTTAGDRLLFPCGNLATSKPWLGTLRQSNRTVDAVIGYETIPEAGPGDAENLQDWLAEELLDAVVLTSPSMVDQWAALAGKPVSGKRFPALICIGPTTEMRAVEHGLPVRAVARRPVPEEIVACLIKVRQEDDHGFPDRTSEKIAQDGRSPRAGA